ncbi:hypothetical protein INR49_007072, partial [Caranx melampygus]
RHPIVHAKMIPIFIIITTLVTTAPVKGAMECHLSDTGIDQQCAGALGEPLNFNLPTSANKQIILTKNNVQILRIANNTLKESESTYRDHASFFEHNGTFKIQSVRKSDAGDYTLETHGLTDGVFLHKTKIHLKIQVSQPVVSQVCLSPEQMRVSCSSEGDGVEFTLTLDSNFLIKTREPRAGSTDNDHMPSVTIKLNGQLTGTLTCI